jgi:hypothetical protein
LHVLRTEADKKEDELSEKNCEIHVLQSKINSLANQLDTLKYINNSLMIAKAKENDPENKEKKIISQHKKQKSFVNILDKNIIKPIKGGKLLFFNFKCYF